MFMISVVLHWCICVFEKVGTSSSLYRLALAGKGHHQSASPEILEWACYCGACLEAGAMGTGLELG